MQKRLTPSMVALLVSAAHLLLFGVLFFLGPTTDVGILLFIELPIYLVTIIVRGTAGALRLPVRRLDRLFGPAFFGIGGSVLNGFIAYLVARYFLRRAQIEG